MTIEHEKEIAKAMAIQIFSAGSVDAKKIAEIENISVSDVEDIGTKYAKSITEKVSFFKEMEGGA